MRMWRRGQDLLIEREAAVRVLGSLLDLSGRHWIEGPADYTVLSGADREEQFDVQTWSIEDELGATLYSVEGAALVRIDVRGAPTIEVRESVVLDGLQATNDADALERVAEWLHRKNAADRAREEQERERVRRVAGVLEEQGLGADFAVAQRALVNRVARYDDERSEELLSTLLDLGGLYREDPRLEESLGIFVWACRRAAYDRTLRDKSVACTIERVGEPKARLGWRARGKAEKAAAMLQYLERALAKDGDDQEYVDANANATVLRDAARGVGRARAALQGALAAQPYRG